MENKIKFQIEFISLESNKLNLRYKSNEEINVKIMRLHNTSVVVTKPELSVFRNDTFKGEFEFSLPLKAEYVRACSESLQPAFNML